MSINSQPNEQYWNFYDKYISLFKKFIYFYIFHTLQVRVPVLSEKMYCIYPNSSFRFELYTAVGIPEYLF